jgi:hypothetical protein
MVFYFNFAPQQIFSGSHVICQKTINRNPVIEIAEECKQTTPELDMIFG